MLKHRQGFFFILCNESFILVSANKQPCHGLSEGEYNAPLSLSISNLGSKATRATGYHLFNGGHSPLSHIFQPLRLLSMSSQEFQEKFVDTKCETPCFPRHPEYYKEDGDFDRPRRKHSIQSRSFIIGSYNRAHDNPKVHRFLLSRDSSAFADMFKHAVAPRISGHDATDEGSLLLNDSREELSALCWALYALYVPKLSLGIKV